MIEEWFKQKGWKAHPFQKATWKAQRNGQSGLIQVPTGSGKTYAAYGGLLDQLKDLKSTGLKILYLTPLRAMTRDLELALAKPLEDIGLSATVESRTGDTSSSVKARQKRKLPEVLLTTPESLTLLLTYPEAERLFAKLDTVIVDEWHELLSSKRGTQVELALARLREWHPRLKTWGMSATLANPNDAMAHLVPHDPKAVHITASIERPIVLESVIPEEITSLPWAGNMGLRAAKALLDRLDPARPTLVFTNTRNQAEMWHEAIIRAKPKWIEQIGLHHGSLDRDGRELLESGLKTGKIRLVVATSSLDLGVDFSLIEQVVQIGSPKGIARLMQRAGRSNHRMGEKSKLLCMPASVLHLLEFAAAREAIEKSEIEAIHAPHEPLDVLCQHIVTRSIGTSFNEESLFEEITSTKAYESLSKDRFNWALQLVASGGKTLNSYPDYGKLMRNDLGDWTIKQPKQAKRHRMMIGTITSDSMVQVRFLGGGRIGNVEESFASRLKPREKFLFGGKVLQQYSFRDMTLFVKRAKGGQASVPRWLGGKMPLSNQLANALRRSFDQIAKSAAPDTPELRTLEPVLRTQQELSHIPKADEVLFETCKTREGYHAFCFTFEGRLVNDGLAALLAYRMGQVQAATFTMTASDYGIEWLCPEPFPFQDIITKKPELFSLENLLEDTLESINVGEMAKRQFRGIARIAGLTFDGYPGSRKSGKQLQASSGLLYDVFSKYDPENLLIQQAQEEVLENQFEEARLRQTLKRLQSSRHIFKETPRPTPLSLPLIADRLTSKISTESLEDRIARIQKQWLR
ncbi:MAG: ligase-associated DNA damage response DEXH box helicase [Verrucomicrobiota bacterium]